MKVTKAAKENLRLEWPSAPGMGEEKLGELPSPTNP